MTDVRRGEAELSVRRRSMHGSSRARRSGLTLTLALAFSAAASVALAERVRLDGIAAIVGGTSPSAAAVVLLHSDVELEVVLGRARSGADTSTPATNDEREAARERLIGRALLVHEAKRLRLDVVDDAHRTVEWRRFFELHGGARAVEAIASHLSLGPDELDRYVEADVIARGFALASAEQGGVVTEAEIEATFESGQHPFVGMDLESVREPLRALLLERRIETESVRWIERLRERVVVRRNRRG